MNQYDITFKGQRITVDAIIDGNNVQIASITPWGSRDAKTYHEHEVKGEGEKTRALSKWPIEDQRALCMILRDAARCIDPLP